MFSPDNEVEGSNSNQDIDFNLRTHHEQLVRGTLSLVRAIEGLVEIDKGGMKPDMTFAVERFLSDLTSNLSWESQAKIEGRKASVEMNEIIYR